MKHQYLLYGALAWVMIVNQSCGDKENKTEAKIFELVQPENSGIDFTNIVPENDTLNQFTYHYLFNGNGVAAGDINNDGLTDLVFSGNAVPAKLYLNKGDFKFEDITQKAGLKTSGWMSGITMADVNNDGFIDIYISRSGPQNNIDAKRNLLFINNKNTTFTEKAKEWGVDDPGNATQAAFFDYDNDGDLDMYMGNHADRFFSDVNVPFTRNLHLDIHNQQHLYRNDGSKFTDVSEEAGIKSMGYCLSASVGDFNRDGFSDIYVCNDYHVPDYYFVNNGDGTFTESFNTYFKHSSTNSMGSDAADYNNDGWLDLMTLDMLADDPKRFMELGGPKDYDFIQLSLKNGYGHQVMKNNLQTNRGNGYFSDLAYLNGVAKTDWSWSPLFCDFDNDGLTDLFITNGYYRDVTNQDFQLFSNRKLQQTGQYALHKEILEKLPFERLSNFAYKNKGDYKFESVAEAWGLDDPTLSSGSAYADLNNDGRMDLIVCNQGDKAQLYKNIGTEGNWLKIKFKGNKNNKNGIGCKVMAELETGTRICEMQTTHGYQSCSEPVIHIGAGQQEKVKSLTIIWPGGAFEKLTDVTTNQVITADESKAAGTFAFSNEATYTFEELTASLGLDYVHKDGDNPDFKREPLLPHRFTRLGPGLASGDVNGDGLSDLFVTGSNAKESAGGRLYIQTADAKFKPSSSQPWASIHDVDMLGCLIFDADADGDNDIYMSAGGSEYQWPSDKYKHKIYINNGTGAFTEKADALPKDLNSSGSCATAGDYDNDGDLDLFVAGRLSPGNYPSLDIRSYLLRNDRGTFTDVTDYLAPLLKKPGMICAASFMDYNNDNKLDLVVAGEWMSIAFLQNTGDKFIFQGSLGTSEMPGWYNSILPVDIDNDGDLDLIAGNKGENSFIQARMEEPLKIYWTDLDNNGTTDLWMSYTRNSKDFPLFQLDEMGKAYPTFINPKFTTYADFSGKTVQEIFGTENSAKNQLRANNFSSLLLKNNGSNFEIIHLPRLAQAGPIYGLAAMDCDGNGFLDVLGVGNSGSPRVTHGRDDALNGITLMNTKGNLTAVDGYSNGFVVPGDAKSLVLMPSANGRAYAVASQNNGKMLSFALKASKKFFAAKGTEFKAIVKLKNGSSRIENLTYGSGYLSCSQPGVWADASVSQVTFTDSKGNSRTVKP